MLAPEHDPEELFPSTLELAVQEHWMTSFDRRHWDYNGALQASALRLPEGSGILDVDTSGRPRMKLESSPTGTGKSINRLLCMVSKTWSSSED